MSVSRDRLWDSGHDESVEVNQRALIDKVLARYSGEFTVFRELLQNSDDAASNSVEIYFETQSYLNRKETEATAVSDGTSVLPNLKTELVHQWRFRNNGIAFREEDWNRLKKIAEGNPDEEKIGAFGVGFYSLFSITEEPFITSGGQWMGFYWKDKKDQLYARRGIIPPITGSDSSLWTSFEMPLREQAAIPSPFDLTRFLASSITFMVHIREVSIFFDNKRLARLTKESGQPANITIPKGMKTSSPSSIMFMRAIKSTPLFIEAEVIHGVYTYGSSKPKPAIQMSKPSKPAVVSSGFFSSLFSSFTGSSLTLQTPQHLSSPLPPAPEKEVDPLAINKSSVALHIFSAEAEAKLDRKMITELQRSTKKNPPNKVRLDLIYTGKAEYDASRLEDEKLDQSAGSIFQGLRADLEGTGSTRVFIGHATGQTTGFGGHMAARFIPTVERESIDLVDRNVSVWNKELLYIGGFLARVTYETEMAKIKDLWTASAEAAGLDSVDAQTQTWLTDRCLHCLKFFTFHASTPSAVVSDIMESAFFSSSGSLPFPIVSSVGVQSASNVRIPDPAFSAFLKKLPMLPDMLATEARMMIDSLRNRGLIKDITFADVLAELRARPLSEAELIACMRWWIKVWLGGGNVHSNLAHVRAQLIDATLLTIATGSPNEKIIPMLSIKTFINLRSMGSILPLDGPLPQHTLCIDVSRNFVPEDLMKAFGWQELTVLDWVQNAVNPMVCSSNPAYDLSLSAVWAERVLNVVAKAWPTISRPIQEEILKLLKDKHCIPTSSGMKLPEETYFQTAHIFSDLPIIALPKNTIIKGNLQKLLVELGVRKHVDLQIVFNRMIKTGDWTISDLIKYLVAVQQNLTPVEMDRLRQTSAFPKEIDNDIPNADQERLTRHKASELYEPQDIFRQLKLPVIDWGLQTKWRSSSEEAKFLYTLGLIRTPPLPTILKLAADQDKATRSVALKYFLDNFQRYPDYDPANFWNLAYIPAITPDGKPTMGTPSQVFVNVDASLFGLLIVDPSVRDAAVDKLKLETQPSTSLILPVLSKSPPADLVSAQKLFEVLAGRISDFTPQQLKQLSEMRIVPAQLLNNSETTSRQIELRAPKDCYFKRDSSQTLHSKLFIFVDFGAKANAFLSACGTKHEPSVEEIVQTLLSDPKRFFRLSGGRENYLTELRNIAFNKRFISSSTIQRMKTSPILLGSQRIRKRDDKHRKSQDDIDDLDEDEWESQYDLLKPGLIVIADDSNAYQLFGDSIFCAPQEDILEEFYMELGSPRLSSLVKDDYKTTSELKNSKTAEGIRMLILERLPLFLHEHTHARPLVQYSWLNNDKNFIVKAFGKLTVAKYLSYGAIRLSRNQEVSAAARKSLYGPLELWLAGNTQVDMYEVAMSLCRVLFKSPKANDALLFMTILSTDLRALKRRGYNVDRILKKQRAEREALELARTENEKGQKELERLVSDARANIPSHSQSDSIATQPTTASSIPIPGNQSGTSTEANARQQRPLSGITDQIQAFRRKFVATPNKDEISKPMAVGARPSSPSPSAPKSRSQSPTMPGALPSPDASSLNPLNLDPIRRRPQGSSGRVTSHDSIESNVRQAINACREERGSIIRNREEMQTIRESLDDGYCDISGRVGDLALIGTMSDVKFFVSKEVPDGSIIFTSKSEVIARFIYVIKPLRNLYKLPPASISIFFDLQGDSIAFNRNGSIFLNLRYFESWHDKDVEQQVMSKAFISWFFSLAHEIAHNLVHPHNSEHEFYFSSICEAHIEGLGQILNGAR